MTDLKDKHCRPSGKDTPALDATEAAALAAAVPGWEPDTKAGRITRSFAFKNYYQTVAFVNAVAWIAHRQDHHPDMRFGYRSCTVDYTTHAVGGLSQNDFICAARINALYQDSGNDGGGGS